MPAITKASQGIWLVAAAAAIALLLTIVAYFTPHGAIAHDYGTLLVLVSSALMLMAALLIARWPTRPWAVTTFEVLILLDIFGTAFCAYFLEFISLLAVMAVALAGWVMHQTARTAPSMTAQP
jgi:hypothetical protein